MKVVERADASSPTPGADTKKYEMSSHMVKYICGGKHSFPVLHDFLDKPAPEPLELIDLHSDR